MPPVFPGAFDTNGMLYVPNRGWLRVLPGDIVAVGSTSGWPILLSANSLWNIANFRSQIVKRLAADGHRLVVAAPATDNAAGFTPTEIAAGVPYTSTSTAVPRMPMVATGVPTALGADGAGAARPDRRALPT